MKYFYDTEFWERPGRIDLISIGIVDENGRKFYAVNTDFDWATCKLDWLHKNVKPYLTEAPGLFASQKEIKKAIVKFVADGREYPEWWGWFSAYDHVCLSMIFGSMVDLPKGWPMFTRDLVQRMHDVGVPRQYLPKQSSKAHNALNDAVWTKEAWDFVEECRVSWL